MQALKDFFVNYQAWFFGFVSLLLGIALIPSLATRLGSTAFLPERGKPAGWIPAPLNIDNVGNFITFTLIFIASLTATTTKPISAASGMEGYTTVCDRGGHGSLLVFVHGWNGDANGTWQNFPKLACRDTSLRVSKVLSINYVTRLDSRNDLRLAELAAFLKDKLAGRERAAEYKSVVFVAHSMGGLLARKMVLQMRLEGSPIKVAGLVEIGSPHLGTQIGTLASALAIDRSRTEEMAPHSSFIQSLNADWRAYPAHPRTFCFSSPQDQVVSEDSAMNPCDNGMLYTQYSHTEMVKPSSADDDRYFIPAGKIREFLSSAP